MLGILKSSDNETVAKTIGNFFPHISDRLIDAIQMYQAKESLKQNYSLALIDASFVDLFRQIQGLDFSDAISSKQVYRMRKFVFSAFALFLLVFVISPSGFLTSVHRIANYGQTFAESRSIEFDIQPGTRKSCAAKCPRYHSNAWQNSKYNFVACATTWPVEF